MEKQTVQTELTKANESVQEKPRETERANGVFLNATDAEEFRAYKRKKRALEIAERITRSQGTLMGAEDIQRVCERARRLKQKAVQLPLTKLSQAKYYLSGSNVLLDCVVGGTGETLAKIKAYETKCAVKSGAKEITLKLAPSFIDGCRFSEIRKEIKKVKRAAGKAVIKVWAESGCVSTALSRAARIASEAGVSYFCVSYFSGCEKLRLDVTGGCKLQISGVNDADTFKQLTDLGVARIVTDNAWEIYNEWLKEEETEKQAEKAEVREEKPAPVTAKKAALERALTKPENDYRCRLEGTTLKFF